MFEHLDDRDGFHPSPSLLTTVTRAGVRRRRRTRVVQAGTASVAALAIGAGVAVTSFNRRIDSIERIEVAGLVDPPTASDEPYTLLLTGLDQGQPGVVSLPYNPDGTSREVPLLHRSDTIALVRLFPADQRVTVLQLPRDLLVDIPGHGQGRINAALPEGGPGLLVETIEANFGIVVNHYASVDFDGARSIGDAIGGLSFDFRYPTRDRSTGFSIESPGCHTLDGQGLLAFVRSRHLETEVTPGNWSLDSGYDLSRMVRQQDVALAALATFSRLDPADPAGVARFVDAVVANVLLDSSFDGDEILQLFRDVAGSDLVDVHMRVDEATLEGGAAVLAPVRDRYFDDAVHLFLEGSPPADREPIDPTDLFPPSALQPQPQHFTPC